MPHGLPPPCDLHRHLYGSITAGWWLEHIARRAIDWTPYEDAYRLAYDRPCPLRGILSRYRANDPQAAADFARLFTFGPEDGPGFERFQCKHDLLTWSSALADPALRRHPSRRAAAELPQVIQQVAADCRREGLGLAELRIMLPAGLPLAVAQWLWQLLSEAAEAASDAHCQIDLVASLPRAQSLAAWEQLAASMLSGRCQRIVAVDLCHREERQDITSLIPLADALHAFNRAHPQHALALLVHVGESYQSMSLESACRRVHQAALLLRAHRLGHALAAGVDPAHHGPQQRQERIAERLAHIAYDLEQAPALIAAGLRVDPAALQQEAEQLRQRDPQSLLTIRYDQHRLRAWQQRQQLVRRELKRLGCVVECCPISNQRIAGFGEKAATHHPLGRFLADGVAVVLGSDDPGLFAADLADNLTLARSWLGPELPAGLHRAWHYRSRVLSGREPRPA